MLITGETGTGKELLSQSIHTASPRAKFDFIAINMESLNPQLFESQFFGHKKGAFTGAETRQVGYLESNNRGLYFWMKSVTCRLIFKESCLEFCRKANLSKLAHLSHKRSMCVSLLLPTRIMELMVRTKKISKRSLLPPERGMASSPTP